MASIILRTLSGATQRALKARAAANGRTVEAEIVQIVETAVHAKAEVGLSGFDFGEIVRQYSSRTPETPEPTEPSSGS